MRTAIIIIGKDSDASLTLASGGLSERVDEVLAIAWESLDSLPAAASALAADQIVLLPYSLETSPLELSALEDAVEAVRRAVPERDTRLAPQLGFDRRLIEILQDRVVAAQNNSSFDANVPIITVERQGQTRPFSLADLLALPDRLADIGTLVPNRSGEAVSIDALLSASELADAASTATFKSGEDFSADVDLAVALEKGWLVFWLDDAPLPARYGGPVRLFIPGIDDRCANVKSVDRLIVE